MTIIVYDQKSLITDSRGIAEFGDARSLAYHAPKIILNESRTVALAYCGQTQPDWLNQWFLRHAEMALVRSLMVEVRNDHPDNDVITKAMNQARTIADAIPFPAKDLMTGIAISQHHAVSIGSGEVNDITENHYNGAGCYLDSYWLMRAAGSSVAQTMQRLNEYSNLVGGDIQMQLQSDLADFDMMDYVMQINATGDYKDITFSELRLRALAARPSKTAKANKCTTFSTIRNR